jgi:type I restriction enzyme R subunit
MIQDRQTKGRERLDKALETPAALCEPVEPPKGELEFIHCFCGNTEIPSNLEEREPQRSALYKATASLVRSYANTGLSAAEESTTARSKLWSFRSIRRESSSPQTKDRRRNSFTGLYRNPACFGS